jgi:hypothetical protein
MPVSTLQRSTAATPEVCADFAERLRDGRTADWKKGGQGMARMLEPHAVRHWSME